MRSTRWHRYENAAQVAQSTLTQILQQAEAAISTRGQFKLVLAGGTTPQKVYELLAEQQQEWSKWFLFIGDERCLPADDAQRNSLMIQQAWLDKVNFPQANFFPIHAEKDPQVAAEEYAATIGTFLPFDMTLLGMGEDGHTASLFPGHAHPENVLTHAVFNSPKPPPKRVSLSKKALFESEKLLILVTGKGKRDAVKQWQSGMELPVAGISARNGVDVLIDQDALPD
jgi:6-phosphogluconolactonase